MAENVSKQSSKKHIKIDDIKRALQSGDTDKAILVSQQALINLENSLENTQEKLEILYILAVAQRTKGLIGEATETVKYSSLQILTTPVPIKKMAIYHLAQATNPLQLQHLQEPLGLTLHCYLVGKS